MNITHVKQELCSRGVKLACVDVGLGAAAGTSSQVCAASLQVAIGRVVAVGNYDATSRLLVLLGG